MSSFWANFLGVFLGYFTGTGMLLAYSEIRERARKKERDAYAAKILGALTEPMTEADRERTERIGFRTPVKVN